MPDIDELLSGDDLTDEEKARIRDDDKAAPTTEDDPAPEPEAEATEDPAAEDEPEDVPEPSEQAKKPRWLKDLDKAKARARAADERAAAAEAKIAEQEARWKAAEERLNGLTAAQKPAEPEAPSIPEYDVDPLGHLAARAGIHEQVLVQAVQTIQQQQQNAASAQRWQSEVADVVKETPDWPDAVNYLAEVRKNELETVFGMKESDVHAALTAEAHEIRQAAARIGKSAPLIMYEMAKARGYTGAAKESSPAATATADLKRISDGQRKAAASNSNGGGDMGIISLETLAEMSADEYDDYLTKRGGSLAKVAKTISR